MAGRLPLRALVVVLVFAATATAQDGDEEVCQADGTGCQGKSSFPESVTRAYTAEDGISADIHKLCPLAKSWTRNWIQGLLKWFGRRTGLHQKLSLWPEGISADNWADDYTSINYLVVARIMLGMYSQRDKSWVNVPHAMASGDEDDLIRVENVHAPHLDVDGSPNFFWFEHYLPGPILKYLYTPSVTCFYSTLRRMSTDNNELNGTFLDTLDDEIQNTWEAVLKDTKFNSKVDWVNAFYEIAKTWDGDGLWPKQMTQFSTYYKNDEWDDRLEYAIAFHLIGSHRVNSGEWTFKNPSPGIESVTLPFRVPLNIFGSFEVRKFFGRYGADLYFNEDGLPVLIETPDGKIVMRGDKQWQYWKFVWQSTFITAITLVDHLHVAHFRTANLLSRAVREALSPDYPLRRLASIFTFGSIFVNMQAMHTLAGPNHLLHRATPFKDFTKLSSIVPSADSGIVVDVPDIPGIKTLMDDKEWAKLHPKLKEAPFYADGRLVINALRKLADAVFEVSWDETMCMKNGTLSDDMKRLQKVVLKETEEAHYAINGDLARFRAIGQKNMNCDESVAKMLKERLVAYFFVVTGWHRHVGFVGDYYLDPELATMSWKDGEKFGRPKQHILMTVINVFTSTKQPLLKEDYSHLFEGMKPDLGKDFKEAWNNFIKDLTGIESEIDRRNKKREIFNMNMHPSVLESAISK